MKSDSTRTFFLSYAQVSSKMKAFCYILMMPGLNSFTPVGEM